jgi:hypothetical protein
MAKQLSASRLGFCIKEGNKEFMAFSQKTRISEEDVKFESREIN